jgi:hypothetical protein
MTYVFDIETDGINASKIHCLSVKNEEATIVKSYSDYDEIREFFLQEDLVLVGHNIVRYDIPKVERLLQIKVHATLIDTLALSWYIAFDRPKHGLEGYGEDFGVPKPKIDDWENLSLEQYMHRCSEDVKINHILWQNQKAFLLKLYKSEEQMFNFIKYLTFKMDCLQEQEEMGLVFDKELCLSTLQSLEHEKELKIKELKEAMPKVPVKVKKSVPKVLYKANGSLSARGKEWFDLLESKGLAPHTPEIEVIKEYEEPNPNSNDQLKKWLFSLGWVPEHIKYVRNKENNTVKQIPQIASKQGGGEICESIKKLAESHPALNALDGLSVISHRIGLFTGFLKDAQDNKLYARASGLTNTLRLQHAVIVNLPSVERKYGKEVRGCLIANEGSVLCGSDLSGIEDSTKRHYIFKYDPKYVEEMNKPDWDGHVDIACLAGFLSRDEEKFYKWYLQNNK